MKTAVRFIVRGPVELTSRPLLGPGPFETEADMTTYELAAPAGLSNGDMVCLSLPGGSTLDDKPISSAVVRKVDDLVVVSYHHDWDRAYRQMSAIAREEA